MIGQSEDCFPQAEVDTAMKRYRKFAALTAAVALAALTPLQTMAAAPAFAYDEATWARLQDNVMEYEELPLLVETYNPTYLNNQTTYQSNRTHDDAEEIRDSQYSAAQDSFDAADSFRDQAEDLADMGALMAGPAMATAYAGLMTAASMMEQNALKAEQAADASYEDSEMRELSHRVTQNSLITNAQSTFASYHIAQKSLDILEKNLAITEASVGTVGRQVQLGMATQTDLLKAQQSLKSLQSTYTQTKASVESVRQQLCLMTGWSYDAQPEIRPMPAADTNRIAMMNLETDTKAALDANLSLKVNRKALKNMAEGSSDRKNMERTIANQEETIKTNMSSMYSDVQLKHLALQLAQTALESETKAMNAANTKFQLGMISQMELLQAEASFAGKQMDLETANINLQQAIEKYEWALKGY